MRPLSPPPLVFVTPGGFCSDERLALSLVEGYLSGGGKLVQVRDRRATDSDIIRITSLLVREFGANYFSINGPVGVELIRRYPSLGLHLRQVDVPIHLRALSSDSMRTQGVLSCSAHGVGSIGEGWKYGRPDYFQVGTMFTTRTHPGKEPEGPSLLAAIRAAYPNICPLIGVGGITEERVPEVISRGADGVAVITAISDAKCAKIATQRLIAAVESSLAIRD